MGTTLLKCFHRALTLSTILVFVANISSVSSQELDSASTSIPELEEPSFSKIIIVPFETRMYFSNIDGALSKNSGNSPEEIKGAFRFNLQHSLFAEIKTKTSLGTISLLSSENEELQEDLLNLHAAIGYNYKEIPVEPDTTRPTVKKSLYDIKDKLKTWKKKEEPKAPTTDITSGELTARSSDGLEKFMATMILDQEAFSAIGSKYEADLFLFINQIDIRTAAINQNEIWNAKDEREIKVHFSILNKQGVEVYASAFKSRFTSQMNEIDDIINSSIQNISAQIANQTPKKTSTKAQIKKTDSDQLMMKEQNILGK
ncbi:MAG: hypothetical protein HRT72_10760 [Flavobacteriales bacterium]|nr:hypothetical protein [Flavobacteriales bacterium]